VNVIGRGISLPTATIDAERAADESAAEAVAAAAKALDIAKNADRAAQGLRDNLAAQEAAAVDEILNECEGDAQADLEATKKKIGLLAARAETARIAAADREREADRVRTTARVNFLSRAVNEATRKRDETLARLLEQAGDTLTELAKQEAYRLDCIAALRFKP
jgi:hypothetical protein